MRTGQHNSASQRRFLRTLSTNLHEMAQPLSTIQASLELALLSLTTAGQYRETAEDVLIHLRRAVELMQFSARLALFQQPAADVRDVSLVATLREVLSDLQPTFETAQLELQLVGFEYDGSGEEQLINISPTRLRQMIFYVLQAVQGCSEPGDIVNIEIQRPAADHLVLRLQHSRSDGDETERVQPLRNVTVERAIALADSIVSSSGGEFSVSACPLLIIADFPAKHETNKCAAVAGNKLSTFAKSQLAVSSH
jgi:hypothetical protein